MRILVVSNLYPPFALGGYEVVCSEMVQALRARGHHVRVLSAAPRLPLRAPVPEDPDVVRTLRVTDLFSSEHFRFASWVRQRLTEASSHFVDAANVYALSHEIDIFRPDVIYASNLRGIGGLGLLAAVQYRRVPWVCRVGDAMPKFLCELDGRPLPPLAREVSRRLVGTWLPSSRRVLGEVERDGPRLNGPVELFPAWLPERDFRSAAEPYRAGDTLRLVYSGSVTHHKGVAVLIDAVASLRSEGIELFTLDLIGPVLDADLVTRVGRCGLESRVRFLGPRQHHEVLRELAAHHLFGFATHEREAFGVAPLEAAAAGCVPLISDICGIAEWLVGDVHCLKAPPTVEGFSSVLRRLVTGEVELAPLSRRARSTVLRDFGVSNAASRMEAILQRAAASGREVRGDTVTAHRAALVAEHVMAAAVEEATIA